MKIAVTTPTGHVGSRLSNLLLDRGAEVTLIARNPEKVKDLAARGARVIAGQHDNADVLEKAVAAADALFWVTPPNQASTDPIGAARHFADEGATVIRNHPELHVVQLSSIGAHRPDGTGPIVGLHMTEERFRQVGKNVVSLRPNYFMENIFNSLPTIASDGAIYNTAPGSTTAPQIATRDIADIAADFLTSPRNGHRIVDIAGPDNFSFDEMAALLTRVVQKTIRVVNVPGEALKQGLKQAGISEQMAELYLEMEEAFAAGLPHEFLGDEKRVGKIKYEQFVRETFLPAYQSATKVARAS
jgi:uncharacterized protein YbjT (DUF2867 family)